MGRKAKRELSAKELRIRKKKRRRRLLIAAGIILVLLVAVLFVWLQVGMISFEELDTPVSYTHLDVYKRQVPLLIYGAFAIFVSWHPQWLAIFAPFLALAVGVNEKRRSLLYCEWGIGLTYCALSNVIYAKNVDNYMVNYGILPMLTGHTLSLIHI